MGKDRVELVIRLLMYECDHVINVVSKASGGIPLGSRTIEKGNFEITLIAGMIPVLLLGRLHC